MAESAAPNHYGTLGDLRELTADLPDDTLIQVSVRKAHDPDHFYESVLAEDCISVTNVHWTGRPVISIDVYRLIHRQIKEAILDV